MDALPITHSATLGITRTISVMNFNNATPDILPLTHSSALDITGPNPNV